HRLLLGEAALHTIEQRLIGNLGGGRLVLEHGGRGLGLDIGDGVGAALVADQERVAIGEVAGADGAAGGRDQPAIGVVGAAGGDALGDDPARGVAAEMDHLGAGIDLLAAVGDRDGIELAAGIVAPQDAARVLPGDRRAGLHLGPRDLGVAPAAVAALGHEVEDAAAAFGIAGIPVLDRRILDLGIV